MARDAVVVQGLSGLVRAFKVANLEVAKDVRTAIETAGVPIRDEASALAHSEISGMARSRLPWWSMRTGIFHNTIGYIAPEQRGIHTSRKRKLTPLQGRQRRPNLKPLLLDKAMDPALEHNRDRVFDEFNDALGEVAKAWARVA